jgi:predicted amidohydrolase
VTVGINRRRLFAAAGFAAAAAFPAAAKYPARPKPALVAARLSVAAVQRAVASAAELGAARAIAMNLAAMDEAIARAQSAGRKHLIAFSGRALQGRIGDNPRAAAIAADGPEVAAIAAMAQRHGVHISFGALIADRDRPSAVMTAAILIDPDGRLIACDDKARARVHDTAIGRIALGSAHGDAELVLHTPAWGEWPREARPLRPCFSVFTAEAACGQLAGSAIFGPDGEVLAEASSAWSQVVTASLPIADRRRRHRLTAFA